MGDLCWINIGPGGTFRRSGAISTAPADVDRLLGSGLRGHRLVLHFHGGLVGEAAGRRIAEKMALNYGAAALCIGLVWETGFLEVFRDNLRAIHRLKAFRKALAWCLDRLLRSAEIAGSRGGGAAAAAADSPSTIEDMLETEAGVRALDFALEQARPTAGPASRGAADGADSLEALALDVEIDLSSDPSLLALVERGVEGGDAIRTRIGLDTGGRGVSAAGLAWFIARIVVAVLRRLRNGTDHGVFPTAVEELLRAAYLAEVGQFAWVEMKKKALAMWTDDGATPGENGHVGGYLLRRLEALAAARPDVKLDLVGHSAGSIAICHMLDAMESQQRRVPVRNIVFLAPAVRLDAFAARIARRDDSFSRFRAFTMVDSGERADKLVGELYPRSLLYFISGVLEDQPDAPLAGMARHILAPTTTAGSEFDDVRAWLSSGDRLVLAPTADDAEEGLRTRSAHHGDFDDDPSTIESLVALARS